MNLTILLDNFPTTQDDPITQTRSFPVLDAFCIALITCLLSFFGDLCLIYTYYKYVDLRTTGQKLLLYITIADVVNQISNIAGIIRYAVLGNGVQNVCEPTHLATFCRIQSFVSAATATMVFLWTMVIALYFLIGTKNMVQAEKIVFPSHFICWLLPVIILSISASQNVLGEDHIGGWCWITECKKYVPTPMLSFFWRLITVKLWEFIAYILVMVTVMMVKIKQHRSGSLQNTDDTDDDVLPLIRRLRRTNRQEFPQVISPRDHLFIWIPLGVYLLRFWGTYRFIVLSFAGDDLTSSEAFRISDAIFLRLQGAGDNALGFFNFVVFCIFSKDARTRLFSCKGSYGDPSNSQEHFTNYMTQDRRPDVSNGTSLPR